jgi:hypothetical protein
MPLAPSVVADHPNTRTRELRVGVLHLGSLLGWDVPAVARFAAAVTGHPWNRCGRAELERVLDAYLMLAQQVRATRAGCQPRARRQARCAK